MTKQRRTQRNKSFGNMSFVERAGLLFGVVALLADGIALFTFATGVSSINQYIPPSVPTRPALLFFSIASGLIIIYGWFAVSWYLVRRTFVLLGQMPIRFHAPLVRRSIQTVLGIGIFLVPIAISWSIVNLPDSYMKEVGFTPLGRNVTVTPPPSLSQTPTDPDVTAVPITVFVPSSDEEKLAEGRTQYYMFCFPFYLILAGFIVLLPINLLMPIVHVELLLEGIDDDILEELKKYLED